MPSTAQLQRATLPHRERNMINTNLLNKIYTQPATARSLTDMLNATYYYVSPVVTVDDAKRGFITRYFIYTINDSTYISEIDAVQYENFKDNPRFIVCKIDWKIVGSLNSSLTASGAKILGVQDFNRQQVQQADLTFKKLHTYITDYTELWLGEVV